MCLKDRGVDLQSTLASEPRGDKQDGANAARLQFSSDRPSEVQGDRFLESSFEGVASVQARDPAHQFDDTDRHFRGLVKRRATYNGNDHIANQSARKQVPGTREEHVVGIDVVDQGSIALNLAGSAYQSIGGRAEPDSSGCNCARERCCCQQQHQGESESALHARPTVVGSVDSRGQRPSTIVDGHCSCGCARGCGAPTASSDRKSFDRGQTRPQLLAGTQTRASTCHLVTFVEYNTRARCGLDTMSLLVRSSPGEIHGSVAIRNRLRLRFCSLYHSYSFSRSSQ